MVNVNGENDRRGEPRPVPTYNGCAVAFLLGLLAWAAIAAVVFAYWRP